MKNQSILFLAILFVGLASSCSRKESLNFNKANNYGVSQSSSSCSSKAKKECTGTKTTEEVVVPVEETPANTQTDTTTNAQTDTATETIIALADVESDKQTILNPSIRYWSRDEEGEFFKWLETTLGLLSYNKTNNYTKANNYGGGSKKEEAVLPVTEEVTAPEEDTDSEKKPSDE